MQPQFLLGLALLMTICHGPEKVSQVARMREVEEWGEMLTVFSSADDGDDSLAS